MTKQQLIQWLKNYIKTDDTYEQKRRETEQAKAYAQQFQKPLKKEEKTGIIGSIFTGILVAIIGAVPVGLLAGIIWLICFFVGIFNPKVGEVAIKIVESSAGLITDDVTRFFNRHEVLGPMAAFLIIGLIISSIIGFACIILMILDDRNVPKRNQEHEEEYANNQTLLAAAEVVHDLKKKKSDAAWENVQRLKKESPIPQNYLVWAEEILQLLENNRADTLKEAINILHADWHREKELREIQRHNKAIEMQNAQASLELSRATNAANRAAEAAEEAAYWEKKKYIDDIFDDLLK